MGKDRRLTRGRDLQNIKPYWKTSQHIARIATAIKFLYHKTVLDDGGGGELSWHGITKEENRLFVFFFFLKHFLASYWYYFYSTYRCADCLLLTILLISSRLRWTFFISKCLKLLTKFSCLISAPRILFTLKYFYKKSQSLLAFSHEQP